MQKTVNAAADELTDPDLTLVRRLGIDEHRYRSVRYCRDPAGGWHRYEPWMTTFVDADTGRVLGVVDGRDSAGVEAWLGARSQAWRAAVEVVAIDPSAAFRRALWLRILDRRHLAGRSRHILSRRRRGRRGGSRAMADQDEQFRGVHAETSGTGKVAALRQNFIAASESACRPRALQSRSAPPHR